MTFKVKLSKNTKAWDSIRRNLTSGGDHVGKIGFFRGTYPEASVPQVAAWQEEGTINIPPRPFIRMGFMQDVKMGYLRKYGGYYHSIAMGTMTWKSLNELIAKDLESVMISNIAAWDTPPNARLTVLKKGFNDPLVETGKLMKSVESRVGRKGS